MDEWKSDDLNAYNEKIKIMASSINAVGLALLGIAVLKPLVEDKLHDLVLTITWVIVGLAMHRVSHYILDQLKRKD